MFSYLILWFANDAPLLIKHRQIEVESSIVFCRRHTHLILFLTMTSNSRPLMELRLPTPDSSAPSTPTMAERMSPQIEVVDLTQESDFFGNGNEIFFTTQSFASPHPLVQTNLSSLSNSEASEHSLQMYLSPRPRRKRLKRYVSWPTTTDFSFRGLLILFLMLMMSFSRHVRVHVPVLKRILFVIGFTNLTFLQKKDDHGGDNTKKSRRCRNSTPSQRQLHE